MTSLVYYMIILAAFLDVHSVTVQSQQRLPPRCSYVWHQNGLDHLCSYSVSKWGRIYHRHSLVLAACVATELRSQPAEMI